MATVSAHPILVVSTNWQTRALPAAQLGETSGCDVVSAPSVNKALSLVEMMEVHPALLVVDIGQHITREDVERLLATLPDALLVLSVSALRRAAFDPLQGRRAAYLTRPVSIGRIAQAVAQVMRMADCGTTMD